MRLLTRALLVLTITLFVLAGIAAAQDLPPKALLVDYPLRIWLTGEGPVNLVYVAPGPQVITMTATSLASNTISVDTTLEVRDLDGSQLAFNDDRVSGQGDAGLEALELPGAGEYVVILDTFSRGESGGVEVRVEVVGEAEPEPGGVLLTVTDTLSGAEPRTFTFDGRAGQVVTITARAVRPPSPDLDLLLTVTGPDGSEIASGDDEGESVGLGERDPAIVGLRLPAAGTYKVRVSSLFNMRGEFELIITEGG